MVVRDSALGTGCIDEAVGPNHGTTIRPSLGENVSATGLPEQGPIVQAKAVYPRILVLEKQGLVVREDRHEVPHRGVRIELPHLAAVAGLDGHHAAVRRSVLEDHHAVVVVDVARVAAAGAVMHHPDRPPRVDVQREDVARIAGPVQVAIRPQRGAVSMPRVWTVEVPDALPGRRQLEDAVDCRNIEAHLVIDQRPAQSDAGEPCLSWKP
mmetsp:Transcript_99814/g.316850  ORF Transcript_99814/g.316850 Transcript_99814/m.316850 type:complete len:210 (+) Transcript_99814:845-1474(+)